MPRMSPEEARRREDNGGQRKSYRQQQNDAEFVDLELSKTEKAALRDFCTTAEELDAELEEFLSDGTKCTFRRDDRNNCFVAFGFPPGGGDNDGYILTGRGGSVSRALRQLLFKHKVILEGEWATYHNRGRDSEGDDW